MIYWNYLFFLSIMRLFGRYLLNCWTFCNPTWCTGASLWNWIVMCKVGLLSSRWQWRFGFSQNDYFSICPVSSELLSLLQPKPQRAWSKCSAVQMNIDFGLVCWCIFMCHVKSWNVQGQVHSEGSNPQWMFFHPISSKPLNSLWWNFISWCCINTPSLYQYDMLVCHWQTDQLVKSLVGDQQGQGHRVWIFKDILNACPWYLLKRSTVGNKTGYAGTSFPLPDGVWCQKFGFCCLQGQGHSVWTLRSESVTNIFQTVEPFGPKQLYAVSCCILLWRWQVDMLSTRSWSYGLTIWWTQNELQPNLCQHVIHYQTE